MVCLVGIDWETHNYSIKTRKGLNSQTNFIIPGTTPFTARGVAQEVTEAKFNR